MHGNAALNEIRETFFQQFRCEYLASRELHDVAARLLWAIHPELVKPAACPSDEALRSLINLALAGTPGLGNLREPAEQ
jgi:hypothetical protein